MDSPLIPRCPGKSVAGPFLSAKDRYRNDPVFHNLVDTLRSVLHNNQATPSELREALMLAAYCEEMENPGPVVHRIESLQRILGSTSPRF